MSALDFRKLRRRMVFEGFCDNGCMGGNEGVLGAAVASHRLAIAGHPAGVYCPTCVRRMKKAWEQAL